MTDADTKRSSRGNVAARSLNDRLVATGGRPTGFDYMRPVLAFGVIALHTMLLTHGGALALGRWGWWIDRPGFVIVPMFFALSGFLVAGSLERSKTLITFLGLRAMRLFPALFVEVTLCALVIGPIFTTYPLLQYATDHRFLTHFLNMVAIPHYYLPGVFEENLFAIVNGQLWTLPCEVVCYVILSLISIGAFYRRRNGLLLLLALCYALQLGNVFLRPNAFEGPTPTTAVLSFIVGVIYFRYRHSIPYSRSLFITSVILTCLLILTPFGVKLFAIPVGYATIYLGLMNPKKTKFLQSGDYSYGIYLYSFPIQQMLICVSPVFRHMLPHFLVASVLATLVAVASWKLIEAPVLRRKDLLRSLETWFMARPASRALRLNNDLDDGSVLKPARSVT